jgi:hypothetical protein
MTPKVRDCTPHVEKFAAYYRKHPAWGALHIVLDEQNLCDGSVSHAIWWAKDDGDNEGLELALLLTGMSKTQRHKIGRLAERAVE